MTFVDRELPFALPVTACFFEKAGAGAKRKCAAGILSAEEEDQEGETLIQKGLDYDYFLTKGFLNDNHDRTIAGIVGYPESIQRFQKGEELPNAAIAPVNCTWVDGYLLDGEPRAEIIWQKGCALQNTPRALGFSVEGKARLRSEDGKTVMKGIVRNAAITHMPVNARSRLDVFLKSLAAASQVDPEDVERAWDAFEKALTHQAIARRNYSTLTHAEAVEEVRTRYPAISRKKARRIVEVIFDRQRRHA